MNKVKILSLSLAKELARERIVIILMILLPILLIFSGAKSAPNRDVFLVIDGKISEPIPSTREIAVTLNAMTAVVLVAAVVSFFLGFKSKNLVPRLRQIGYGAKDIVLSFVLLMIGIDIILVLIISFFSLIWIDPVNFIGFNVALFLASMIFSTIGLIISSLSDTTVLGLNTILTLAVLDTGFLENPIYSRRYTESWMKYMPTHETIEQAMKSVFSSQAWYTNIGFILMYEIALIFIYLLILKFNVGLKSN